MDFREDEEKEEETFICLKAWGDKEIKVYDQTLFSSSDDDIDDLYNKLYELLLGAKKELKYANKKNESLLD